LLTTECSQESFAFAGLFCRQVVGRFDGGRISSDGGGLLLREVEKRTDILKRFAECFRDHRVPEYVEHSVAAMVGQRVYGLALGYEDWNDHEQLRAHPLLGVLAGVRDPEGQARKQERDRGKALAGKSTLNRLELSGEKVEGHERYRKIVMQPEAIDRLLVEVFLEAHATPPQEIVLDLDVTDDPLHGQQQGRCFHGYYGHYCYVPLYIFCGEHLLCARLRSSNRDAAAGSKKEVERIVYQIRQRWPAVRIILRGDSGFCREELMAWCEQNKMEYVFGLARNARLRKLIHTELAQAAARYAESKQAARIFSEFSYQTHDSWSCARRVVAKAEYLAKGENPRFVVTSLNAEQMAARPLYEQLYCARGEMENRIKEQFSLFSDRTSTAYLRSNQLRLYFSSIAYLLMAALRRLGLQGTALAKAQCQTIRLKLLKLGALIVISVRKVWISLSSGYPDQLLFSRVLQQIRR
jgi:Transposase DDE domain group 1